MPTKQPKLGVTNATTKIGKHEVEIPAEMKNAVLNSEISKLRLQDHRFHARNTYRLLHDVSSWSCDRDQDSAVLLEGHLLILNRNTRRWSWNLLCTRRQDLSFLALLISSLKPAGCIYLEREDLFTHSLMLWGHIPVFLHLPFTLHIGSW